MKNQNTIVKTWLALAAALIWSVTASAQAFQLDHYLSYDIKTTSSISHSIKLKDQFIDWTDFRVNKPMKLLNPAVKRHNNQVYGITNPQLHYTAYRLEGQDLSIIAPVIVSNQFGQFILEQFRADRLLVPTRKINFTPFDDADRIDAQGFDISEDHYLCYEIPPITIATDSGFLKDQFRGRSFGNLVAKRFCNPVAKAHDGRVSEIINDIPDNHLMCFELDKTRILRVVALFNQFGAKKALVVRDDELCVPSIKMRLPELCVGSTPDNDGVCNGMCPTPSDICLPDEASGACDCFPNQPELCEDTTPDADGMCNGICDNPDDVCLPSLTSDFCQCIPTTPRICTDTLPDPNEQCNGLCPDGEVCVVSPDLSCECQPQILPCGVMPDGQCGGLCPDNLICRAIAGTDICECLQ